MIYVLLNFTEISYVHEVLYIIRWIICFPNMDYIETDHFILMQFIPAAIKFCCATSYSHMARSVSVPYNVQARQIWPGEVQVTWSLDVLHNTVGAIYYL